MNCEQAGELIDLRVQGSASVQECWVELDVHLRGCAACRTEFEELGRVRRCLTSVADDRPDQSEVQAMWTAIQNGGAVAAASGKPEAGARILSRTRLGHLWRNPFVLSTLASAAVLMLAFQIGQLHYGGSTLEGVKRLVSAANVKSIGTSSKIYSNDAAVFSSVDAERGGKDADDPHGWGIPAHSDQFAQAAPTERRSPSTRKERSSANPNRAQTGYDGASPPPSPELPISPSAVRALQSMGYTGGGGGQAIGDTAPPSAPALPEQERVSDYAKHLRLLYDDSPGAYVVEQDEIAYGTEIPAHASNDAFRAVRLQFDKPFEEVSGAPSTQSGPKAAPTQSSTQPASPVRNNLKIIKTGELGLQVGEYEAAVGAIERIVAENGGFLADATTREEAGGALVGRIVVRVSPEKFEETFALLKQVGRVESENVKAADVTAEYVDLEARIKGLQITEERLRELIANKSFVDKIQSLLEVEKEMNRVRTEIEQLQGQLRVMADRVAMSTIGVTVREAPRNVPTGSLSVEVATLDTAAEVLGGLLAETGGRLVSGKTSKRSDGTLMGNYQLETTLARFAETVRGVEALGRVEERQGKDQQFSQAAQPWAEQVKCSLALVLFERSRQLPSGSLRIEVDNVDSAVEGLQEMVGGHNAVIASNGTTRQSDGSSVANLQLRVPAGQFAQLVEAMEQLGRMLGKSISGEAGSIVGGAAAVPCEISLTLAEKPREVPGGSMTLEVAEFVAAREALSKAVAAKKAQVLSSSSSQRSDGTWTSQFRLGVPGKEMEAFVSQLEGLGRVAARQIQGLGLGDLSRIDPNALGTIDLVLAEKSAIAPAPDQSTATIRARVREGLSGFYESIGLIAYGLVVLFPWLLLAVLIGWLTLRIRTRARRRIEAQSA